MARDFGSLALRRLAMAVALVAVLHVGAAAAPLDMLVATVDARTIAASDIALARGLGVLGFAPSSAAIARGDVDRFVDVLLLLEEADRIGITVAPDEIDRAWTATVARTGGEEALERWLHAQAIDRAWARRLVTADVKRARFLQERFASFVFLEDAAIERALGPGEHDEAAREQARERLTREAAQRAEVEWLDAARRRAAIRMLLPEGASLPPPFPPP